MNYYTFEYWTDMFQHGFSQVGGRVCIKMTDEEAKSFEEALTKAKTQDKNIMLVLDDAISEELLERINEAIYHDIDYTMATDAYDDETAYEQAMKETLNDELDFDEFLELSFAERLQFFMHTANADSDISCSIESIENLKKVD